MFGNISWTTFFTALFVSGGIYYVAIGVLYYRREFTNFLSKLRGIQSPLATPQVQDRQGDRLPEYDVMGAAREERYMQPSKFVKGDSRDNEVTSDLMLVSAASELMESIKKLFAEIKQEQKSKEETLAMLTILAGDYSQLASGKYRYSIDDFIRDICTAEFGFDIRVEEIDNIWPR